MTRYRDYKKKALADPEVKAAYDDLKTEADQIQAVIDAERAGMCLLEKNRDHADESLSHSAKTKPDDFCSH